MNHKLVIFGITTLLAGALAPVQAQLKENVVVSLSVATQSIGRDNGSTTTFPSPKKTTLNNAALLKILAVDEHMEGNYNATNFPAGAKLIDAGEPQVDFQVVDSKGNLLVDVADLMGVTWSTNLVASGQYDDSTGAGAVNSSYVGTLGFDDSSVNTNSPTTFYVFGLFSEKYILAKPDKNGKQMQTDSGSMSLAGEGMVSGSMAVISGVFSESGNGLLQ